MFDGKAIEIILRNFMIILDMPLTVSCLLPLSVYLFVFYANVYSFLLLSGWDADFATEAYRQQVALAQHQVSKNKLYIMCFEIVV